MKLVYLLEARIELLDAVSYYHSCAPGLAADFSRELERAENDLLSQPEAWKLVGGGYRRKLLRRYPYGLVYHQLGEDLLEVVAVTHLTRRPEYWKDRL